MPRARKQHLKRRKDGRYACRYMGQFFYGMTEDEALAARDEYKRRVLAGQDPSIKMNMTVQDYADSWLPIAKPGVAACTYNGFVTMLNKLISAVGEKPLRQVVPSDIKRLYSTAYKDKSNSYIRSARQLYAGMFDAAVADGIIPRNPVRDKTALPHKGTFGGHRAITPQERTWIETLCKDHRAHNVAMAMLYAGIRPPEAKALNIDESVDFEAGTITLKDFAHIKDSNHYIITDTGKNRKAARTIPLFHPLAVALKDHHGLLITDADGKPVTIQAWRSVWASYVASMETAINGMHKRWYRRTKAHREILAAAAELRKQGKDAEADAKEAEIPPWISFTVRPYDLRHSFATFCRDHGIEMNTVVQWMGHADAGMILRIYDEVSADRSAREAEKLDIILGGSQKGSQEKSDPEKPLAV